jgi:hypothetical protein
MDFMLCSRGRKTETASITLNKKEKGNKLGSSFLAHPLKLHPTISTRHILSFAFQTETKPEGAHVQE